MQGEIYFDNEEYLKKLKDNEGKNVKGDKCELDSASAFIHLIKGVEKDDLENLCIQLQSSFKEIYGEPDLTTDETYSILQGEYVRGIKLEENDSQKVRKLILNQAYSIVHPTNSNDRDGQGGFLGNKTIMDGKINTSGWISHSLHMASFVEMMASELNEQQKFGLDVDGLKALAILHDYGRKFDHTMGHVTKGAEKLIDEGYINAAVATVNHSFFAGKRCANNEPALEGFYMDENGKECWDETAKVDHIKEYLDDHKMTIGDLLLNIGDLVATDKGVVPLTDRLEDIASRRPALDEQPNREFFLLQVINGLMYMLDKMNIEIPEQILRNIPIVGSGVQKANDSLSDLSDILHTHYKKTEKKKQEALKEEREDR